MFAAEWVLPQQSQLSDTEAALVILKIYCQQFSTPVIMTDQCSHMISWWQEILTMIWSSFDFGGSTTGDWCPPLGCSSDPQLTKKLFLRLSGLTQDRVGETSLWSADIRPPGSDDTNGPWSEWDHSGAQIILKQCYPDKRVEWGETWCDHTRQSLAQCRSEWSRRGWSGTGHGTHWRLWSWYCSLVTAAPAHGQLQWSLCERVLSWCTHSADADQGPMIMTLLISPPPHL